MRDINLSTQTEREKSIEEEQDSINKRLINKIAKLESKNRLLEEHNANKERNEEKLMKEISKQKTNNMDLASTVNRLKASIEQIQKNQIAPQVNYTNTEMEKATTENEQLTTLNREYKTQLDEIQVYLQQARHTQDQFEQLNNMHFQNERKI